MKKLIAILVVFLFIFHLDGVNVLANELELKSEDNNIEEVVKDNNDSIIIEDETEEVLKPDIIDENIREEEVKEDNIQTIIDTEEKLSSNIDQDKESIVNETLGINEIVVKNNEVRVGEQAEIYIDITGEVNEINSVEISYILNGEEEYLAKYEYAYMDKNTGLYKANIDIREDMLYRIIEFKAIQIMSIDGKRLNFDNYDFSKYNISIVDQNGLIDMKAPTLKEVTVNTESPKIGEVFEIYVDAEDDVSGIGKVNLEASFVMGEYINEELKYDEELKKYKYSMKITEIMKYKRMKIENITVTDRTGKETKRYGYQLGITSITISDLDGNIDIQEPKFNGITISKNIVKIGESVDILIDAVDEQSGISSVYIQYLNNYGSLDGYELEFDEKLQKYKMIIEATKDNIYNNYEIIELWITDNAGNVFYQEYKAYDLDKYQIYVADKEGNIDDEAPIINKIKASENVAKVGDKIKISVDTIDLVTGIGKVNYSCYYGASWRTNELVYNEESKLYETYIYIDDSMEGKIIKPIKLEIEDKVRNTTEINANKLEELIIRVPDKNGMVDTESPQIKSIKLDKTSARVGEQVKVIVDASDDVSGIKNIYTKIGDMYVNLQFNNDSNLYEGMFIVNNKDVYTNIRLSRVEAEDNAGNMLNLYGDDLEEISLNITDKEGKYDYEKPVLNIYSIIKNKLKFGETVCLKLNVTDDLSGVDRVTVKI